MSNRLLEYDVPSEDELIARLLSSLHKALDEQFPSSGKSGDTSRRFTRTEFSSVSEDTIIEKTPGPAVGESVSDASSAHVVPPPPRMPNTSGVSSATIKRSDDKELKKPAIIAAEVSSHSLALPKDITSLSKPLSRTKVATNATQSNFGTSQVRQKGGGFSLKLFAFLFAILLGTAVGSLVFLFWSH